MTAATAVDKKVPNLDTQTPTTNAYNIPPEIRSVLETVRQSLIRINEWGREVSDIINKMNGV